MADLLNKVGEILPQELAKVGSKPKTSGDGSFAQLLKSQLNDVNEMQVDADKASTDIATGQVKDLHQAAIAIGKAETSMKMMLEVRNKAISAYKEILRTQM